MQRDGELTESPEEHRISEIAHDKHQEIPPANVRNGRTRDLADKGVECEGNHHTDAHALAARLGVEDLSWNDPAQRAAGEREGDLVEPVEDDEEPA